MAAALNHPNLCTIYAVDDSAGVPIISMEYIAGESLSKAVGPGQLPTESLLVDRPPDRFRHGGGPRRGDRARRLEARERDGHGRGPRQGPRLRPGAGACGEGGRSAPTRRPSWGSPRPATVSSALHGTCPPSRSAASPRPRPAMSSRWESSSTSSAPASRHSPADNLLQVLDQIRSVDPDRMAAHAPEPFDSLLRRMLPETPASASITMKEVADTLLVSGRIAAGDHPDRALPDRRLRPVDNVPIPFPC